MKEEFKDKQVIIFDLDGTLAISKSPLDEEMANLLVELLRRRKVIIISGGHLKQFDKQVIKKMNLTTETFANFFIMPGSGSSMYRFSDNREELIYADLLSQEDKDKIFSAFYYALERAPFNLPDFPYGERIEDRDVEITFSALGQNAPVKEKEKWDPDRRKREILIKFLHDKIPEFEIHMGGMTSIDVTKKGINKAYGIRRASKELNVGIEKMMFVGDALYEGGNDEPAKETGIYCVSVKDIDETKKVIHEIIFS
jgi:HAD-superfamily hydrolase, subfamily IIB